MTVRANVDITRLRAGPLNKFVWVYVQGSGEPAVSLEVLGTIKPLVSFLPANLDFGRIPARFAKPITLTATLDSRLVGKGVGFDLISTNRNVTVRRKTGTDESANTGQKVRQQFEVELTADADIGALAGTLSLMATPERGAPAEAAQLVRTSGFVSACGVTAPVVGEVLGNISADPLTLVLPSSPPGIRQVHRLKLTGKTAQTLQGLKIECFVPTVSARFVPGKAMALTGILEVTISNPIDAARKNGHITIATQEGERLVIPILPRDQPQID